MATSQILSLVISAIDRASGILGKVQGGLRGLGNAAEQSRGSSESLSNAIAFGMAKAEIALSLVNQGYAKLQGMVGESAKLQLENMSAAQTFAAVAGKSYEEGSEFIDRMNTSLAKSAAALPGATKDYTTLGRTIQDNLIDAFKGADGKLNDMKGFEGALIGISESYGVLSAASNVPIGNTALGLTKALGGASVAELRQIQAFEQNPALLNEIEKRLQKVGAKTLKDLDAKARVALIKEVGEKFVDGDFKKRAAQTFDGLWQSFMSTLFDPMTGLFGLSRDLDDKAKGTQSAFTSLNTLLNSLIGGGGLMEQVSGILQSLGLTADPMRMLRDGIDRINQLVVFVNGFLGGIRVGLGEGYGDFGELLTSKLRLVRADILTYFSNFFAFDVNSFGAIAQNLGYQLSRALNEGIAFLNGIDYGAVLSNVGTTIAQSINILFAGLFGFLAGLDYGAIAGLASNLAGGLFKGLSAFLMNLDWKVYAGLAAAALVAFLVPGVITFATGLVAAFLAATVGLPALLIAAAMFAVAALAKVIYDNWGAITNLVQEGWTLMTTAVGDAWNTVTGKVSEFFTWIGGLIDQAKQLLMDNPISRAVGGTVNAVGGATAAIGGAISNPAQAVAQTASLFNPTGGVISAGANLFSNVIPKFDGHIPNAASGLIGAAVAESNAMPSGAQVVVANDKEFILKPTGKSGSSGGNTFNFTINGSNAQAIAQEVMALIQQTFDAEMNTQLI